MFKDTQKKTNKKPWYHGKAGIIGFILFFVPLLLDTFTVVSVDKKTLYYFIAGIGTCILFIYSLLHLNDFFN